MTARTPHKRERLDVAPTALLARLPAIGRVMINSERLGATHERIGWRRSSQSSSIARR